MNAEGSVFKKLLHPEGIAVIGASSKEGTSGFLTIQNLLRSNFEGIYPVNPKGGTLSGLKVYPSVQDLPQGVETAIILLAAQSVPGALRQCAEKGIKVAIIGSGGFKEKDDEGADLQLELLQIIKETGIRVLGPNCMGVYNACSGLNFTLTATLDQIREQVRPGNISFITQSGAFGIALFTTGVEIGLNFSKVVSLGNKADIDEVEVLEHLGDDPETDVIMTYIEEMKRGRRFYEVAKQVSKKKPIVAFKVGRTPTGMKAAASHTGALAGSGRIFSAACKQGGVIEVESSRAMLEVCKVFAYQPPLAGNRIGIVTNSGGLAVEVCDLLDDFGLRVPELSPGLQESLVQEGAVPNWGINKNPVDLTAANRNYPDWYYKSAKMLLASGEVDGILLIMVGVGLEWPVERIVEGVEELKAMGKPILILGTAKRKIMEAVVPKYQNVDIPVIDDVRIAARSMAALRERGRYEGGLMK